MDTAAPDRSLPGRLAALETVLREILRAGKFEVDFTVYHHDVVAGAEGAPEFTIDFTGHDADLLVEKNGAVLDALEHVALKAARLDEESHGRILFDARDWRRLREQELKMMAQIAAERVVETGEPFELSPMNPRERRVVHLALRDNPNIRSESEGRGPERRVVLHPLKPPR
jgi:spoIIIJ-associated protein